MKNINAVIMAAGLSSRFAPLSYELPKALLKIHNEVLIERQIRQLREAGIAEIIIVTGYKKDMFEYLVKKYNVILLENKQYSFRNNHESLQVARAYIKNTFICCADNYFTNNVFLKPHEHAYYASVFEYGKTAEWCLEYEGEGRICNVQVGGENAWIMMGHVFFDEKFSTQFFEILDTVYDKEETKNKLWEAIYMEHINELDMYIQKYEGSAIFEFDTLDELRVFDSTFITNTNSKIILLLAKNLHCTEAQLCCFKPIYEGNDVIGCSFQLGDKHFTYHYETRNIIETCHTL